MTLLDRMWDAYYRLRVRKSTPYCKPCGKSCTCAHRYATEGTE